jgi:hypothetical protein
MNLDEFVAEALAAGERFWFVREVILFERTDATVTVHLHIARDLFVQAFLSAARERVNLAFVGPTGRLYGRDLDHGRWHRHPFGATERHEPTPEGMSERPVTQFLTEVEEILLENDLV